MKKILYAILISSHGLIGMAGIKQCQVSCSGKSELVSRSLVYDEDGEPSKRIEIPLDGSPMSFLMVRPPKDDSLKDKASDASVLSSCSSELAKQETQTSKESADMPSCDLFLSRKEEQEITQRAIENFKSLLSEWEDPAVGDYVAVIIKEDFKQYGKVTAKTGEGYYLVDTAKKDKSLLLLKENRLVPLPNIADRLTYFRANLGQFLNDCDLVTLPAITRPYIYSRKKHGHKAKVKQKFPRRVVEKPKNINIGKPVLVALNKALVVEGRLESKWQLGFFCEEPTKQACEPDYSGSLYGVAYTNPATCKEEIGYFTIYRVRMKEDLLDEKFD